MKTIRLIIRGCGSLPYMGHHPGTVMLFVFTVIAGLAGVEKGGIIGFFGGAAFMLIGFGPFYLYGAYARAKESDKLMEKK
jgi:Na+(H+)/acetate symporter ActP